MINKQELDRYAIHFCDPRSAEEFMTLKKITLQPAAMKQEQSNIILALSLTDLMAKPTPFRNGRKWKLYHTRQTIKWVAVL